MNEAVIILKRTPKCCRECRLFDRDQHYKCCPVTKDRIYSPLEKHKNCPLIPMEHFIKKTAEALEEAKEIIKEVKELTNNGY